MKHLKMLGLAITAAMAVMAFVGASSASANVLCKENVSPCPAGQTYGVGSKIVGKATDPLLTGSIEVTCKTSETTVEVTNAGGAGNVTGKVTALNFKECNSGGIGCTVTVNNIPYHAEVKGTGATGELTVTGIAGQPGAKVVCAFFLSCTFTAPKFELGIDEGAAGVASVTAVNEELEKIAGGGICPEESFWDANYISTTAVYVI